MIPEHSTQARRFLLGVDFGDGGELDYPKKNPQARLRSTETQHTYDRIGGRRECRIQRQPDCPRHTAQGPRMVAHSDINPAQQDLTSDY